MRGLEAQGLRSHARWSSLVIVAALAAPLHAARLNVTVQTLDERPVDRPLVCYITSETPPRQESKTAGANGIVSFDLETNGGSVPVRITVTKPGFTGVATDQRFGGASTEVLVSLPEGSGGPTCPLPLLTAVTTVSSLRLAAFKVCHPTLSCNASIGEREGRASARLTYDAQVVGLGAAPTHYRVAATESALRTARWLAVPSGAPEQPIDHVFEVGNIERDIEVRTFFQVKSGAGESNVLADSTFIRVDPNARRDFEVTGAELTGLMVYAKQLGFRIMTVAQYEGSPCTAPGETAFIYERKLEMCCSDYLLMAVTLFTGRPLKAPWRIKNVVIDPSPDCAAGTFATPRFTTPFNVATVVFSNGTRPARPATEQPRTGNGFLAPPPVGLACRYPLKKIVLEGPRSGFSDPDKPWRDAFQP